MGEIGHHVTAAAYAAVCLGAVVLNWPRKKTRR